jgi:hypothetical protein
MRRVPLQQHYAEMQDLRDRLAAERDRRYAEVDLEREKALRIKEKADETALDLARDIQVYKDEKANELREQINRERGAYATKDDLRALSDKFDAAHKPVVEFIAAQVGKKDQSDTARLNLSQVVAVTVAIAIILGLVLAYATKK